VTEILKVRYVISMFFWPLCTDHRRNRSESEAFQRERERERTLCTEHRRNR
jgi:hypothetical protein